MDAHVAEMTAELRAKIVPPAARQATPAAARLHSANAGLVVAKVGQVRSEYRDQARVFARELAEHLNHRQPGEASAFVYEETFGTEDRLHWLIHLRSFDTYYRLVEMGDQDREYRASLAQDRVTEEGAAKAWDRLFLDGELHSTVLMPLPGPTTPDAAEPLNSATAGIVVHRSAQVVQGSRAAGRRYARELSEVVDKHLAGEVSVHAYEEAFGRTDRLHWLLHLRDLASYRRLLELDQLPEEPGLFVTGSMAEVALTPHHWGLYGTREG